MLLDQRVAGSPASPRRASPSRSSISSRAKPPSVVAEQRRAARRAPGRRSSPRPVAAARPALVDLLARRLLEAEEREDAVDHRAAGERIRCRAPRRCPGSAACAPGCSRRCRRRACGAALARNAMVRVVGGGVERDQLEARRAVAEGVREVARAGRGARRPRARRRARRRAAARGSRARGSSPRRRGRASARRGRWRARRGGSGRAPRAAIRRTSTGASRRA